jgi:GWxTD domain-containing protein
MAKRASLSLSLSAAVVLISGLILVADVPNALSMDERLERLSPEERSWLERDVLYIITERERDVFLTLETQEERVRFVEAFWRKRDPNPATPANEYRDEHYRRIEHANKFLGRETFREGWRTDRGRYYILLGEPRETQRFEGYSEVVSTELWFYQGEPTMGLPSFFYLLFFKRNDFGEYRLYHPVVDGPQALLTGSQFTPGTENGPAVDALREISPELAHASLSFDTSEPPDLVTGRPALGTDIMLARVEESPKRAIRTDYADAWMRYGNRVSAEYSFNYVPSRNVVSVLATDERVPIVHISVEIDPENFSLETDEDQTKFYTTLDTTLEARTVDGTLVVAIDKEAFLELTPSQVQEVRASPFAYQDNFPLVPGDYTITAIVRNRVSKQYTVAERSIHVPDFRSEAPVLSGIILAFDTKLDGGTATGGEVRTFQFGATRVQPAAENLFVIGDTASLVTQAVGAEAGFKVRFELSQNGKVLETLETPVDDSELVVDHLKLDDMVGGTYDVVASLLSPSGDVLSKRSDVLTLSPRSHAPRPAFVFRRGFNTRVPGLTDLALGEQLWNLQRFDEAKGHLERAVETGDPRLVTARWKLANAYLREERADEALALLAPMESAFPGAYEVVAGLGFVFYLKADYERAAEYLTRAQAIRPPDTILLNALGDVHQRAGRLEEARQAFERSLELDPEQPFIRERLSSLGSGS